MNLLKDDRDIENVFINPEDASQKKPLLKNKQHSNDDKLSMCTKICFALGGLPYQMCSNTIAFYLTTFLLEISQLRPFEISIILFTARGWDAITDPLVGYFVNKTHTRFGKLRPWILLSTPFAITTYMLTWYNPSISNNTLKTIWYLLIYCLFQTFLSCLHVPYTSLTMYLTTNHLERDKATGLRMIFEVIGVLLGVAIQSAIISLYNINFNCPINNSTHLSFSNNNNNNNNSLNKNDLNNKLDNGYLMSATIVCIIYLICSLSTFFGTREIQDVVEDKNNEFFKSLKRIFKHKSYLYLLVAFLLISLSVQLIQSNIALYCKYSIDAKNQYQFVIITLLVSSILFLPFWFKFMNRYGKKTSYACGTILMIPCLFVLFYYERPVWLVYVISFVAGSSISCGFLLPWSMLPDVIDEYMLLSGTRKESIFYSFFVFFTKFGAGLAVALSTAFLELGGYKDCPSGCCTQPTSVGQTIRYIIVPGPILMILVALLFLWKYPIDEEKRRQIQIELNNLRNLKE